MFFLRITSSFLVIFFILLPVTYIFSQQTVQGKQAAVFEGPDQKAMYLKLIAGDYTIGRAPERYRYRGSDDVIILMENFFIDNSPGNPALPYQAYRIALPPDAVTRSLKVEVIHLVEEKIPGDYKIAPAPPRVFNQQSPPKDEIVQEMLMWDTGKEIEKGRNILVYNKNAFHPTDYCRITSRGQLRKWKVATVLYYPVRYNPVKSRLMCAKEISLKISFVRDPDILKQEKTKKLLRDSTFDKRARDLFLNYDMAKEWYLEPLRKENVKKAGDAPIDPDYAIITTEEIFYHCPVLKDPTVTPAENFCFFKQSQGYSVIVVTENKTFTVNEEGGSYTFIEGTGGYEDVPGDYPDKRPQRIRQWLMDKYLELGIEYVLLIGDPDPDSVGVDDRVGDVPMQMMRWAPAYELPTDFYYADLTGDWNYDNDEFVGEQTPINGETNLNSAVTGEFFSVRWEGVIAITGATSYVALAIIGHTDGRTKIWVDIDNDGFNETDIILDVPDTHNIQHFDYVIDYPMLNEPIYDRTFPIQIEYKHLGDNASFKCKSSRLLTERYVSYKHQTDPGTYENGLETYFYNNDTLTGDPVLAITQRNPYIKYIASGDWDNGGNIEGEAMGVDFYPEVIIGRIPFYSEDQNGDGEPDYQLLDSMLAKIIQYEGADIHQETWRRRVLFSAPYSSHRNSLGQYTIADYQGGEYLMNNVAPPPLWEWYRIHEEDYPDVFPDAEVNTGCTIDEMVNGWNDPDDPENGRGVVMWHTHGSQIQAQQVFEESRIPDLDNSKPSFILQLACVNGLPEVLEWDIIPHYPLGYTLLRDCPAIATISASRDSIGGSFNPNNIDINYPGNATLLYFFAKGIFNNRKVGDVLSHVCEHDATLPWEINKVCYNLYGDPTTSLFGENPRTNNDIVFLLDGSGSMRTEWKWQAAVNAVVLFYELLKKFRYPVFKDRYNNVIFRSHCTIASAATTTTIPPETGLKDLEVPITPHTFIPYEPQPGFCTPVGEGLEMALEQFRLDDEDSFYSNKTILLLSDGINNRGIDPLSVVIPEGIKVPAIGFGEDEIEPETIRDIARASGADFRITPSPLEVEDFFLQILCNTSWKLQDVSVFISDENNDTINDTATAAIDRDFATFIVIWDSAYSSLSFKLEPPGDGPAITPENLTGYEPMGIGYHAPSSRENHAYYVCKKIPQELMGEWRIVGVNDGNNDIPIDNVLCKVIEDPQTIADFHIENIDHYTGQPVTLTAHIAEDGKPITGLNKVYADLISSPDRSAGTLMSKHSPSPGYQTEVSFPEDRSVRNLYLCGVMDKLGLKTLSKTGGPRIYLHDDGVNGDAKAKDGIYTGLFIKTVLEGSYTFRFRARGIDKNGVVFDRTETLSEYIKFKADPEKTVVEIIALEVNRKEKRISATLKVIPRDMFGSYLGPFSGEKINVWSSKGYFSSKYKDNKDGSYTYTLIYPEDSSPLISVSVGNVIVSDRRKIKP